MTEEPYRWLEAIGHRREYVETQLKGGSPVFGVSLGDGILLLGVGGGHSKVFEVFDRHALAGLGHPADLERIRQGVIDAAHVEAFTRAPADVSLRRLVSFGLGPQLKTAFEQIFAPPFLVKILLAELGDEPAADVLVRVEFDGTFELQTGGVLVVAAESEPAQQAKQWLEARLSPDTSVRDAARLVLTAWRSLTGGEGLPEEVAEPGVLREAVGRRTIEAAILQRSGTGNARYRALTLKDPEMEGLAP